ncbi:hypothetical protein EAG_14209 [Camponotus floridanus]|uniref:Uncharacterized protein n=1 Tax=Camponotus floridanus TaxID=104421 RepID=E1ZX25_CAMFO|nr:hypothetical protein EAG_14209 [Camponotus floridanus]
MSLHRRSGHAIDKLIAHGKRRQWDTILNVEKKRPRILLPEEAHSFVVNKNRNLILWNIPSGDRIHRKHRSHSTFFVRSFTHRENEVSRNRKAASALPRGSPLKSLPMAETAKEKHTENRTEAWLARHARVVIVKVMVGQKSGNGQISRKGSTIAKNLHKCNIFIELQSCNSYSFKATESIDRSHIVECKVELRYSNFHVIWDCNYHITYGTFVFPLLAMQSEMQYNPSSNPILVYNSAQSETRSIESVYLFGNIKTIQIKYDKS